MGEPARPGANQATGPPGANGHRRKGPGGAAPLYRGARWRNEARRGRAVSAGASFGSSAASPYILANESTRGATRRAAPGPRGGLPTSPSRRSRVRHSAPRVSNTGSGSTQPAKCLIERRAAIARQALPGVPGHKPANTPHFPTAGRGNNNWRLRREARRAPLNGKVSRPASGTVATVPLSRLVANG